MSDPYAFAPPGDSSYATAPTVPPRPPAADSKDGASRQEKHRIFVGQLKAEHTHDVLQDHFSQFGEVVDVWIPTKKGPGGGSGGYAFVSFATKPMMYRALAYLAPHVVAGHELRVNEAVKKENQAALEAPGRIFVGNIPESIDQSLLREYFSKFGEVTDAYFPKKAQGSRRYAFVNFKERKDMFRCFAEDAHFIEGHEVKVNDASPKQENRAQTAGAAMGMQSAATAALLAQRAAALQLQALYGAAAPGLGAHAPGAGGLVGAAAAGGLAAGYGGAGLAGAGLAGAGLAGAGLAGAGLAGSGAAAGAYGLPPQLAAMYGLPVDPSAAAAAAYSGYNYGAAEKTGAASSRFAPY